MTMLALEVTIVVRDVNVEKVCGSFTDHEGLGLQEVMEVEGY
jgi:hypothetical protein